MSFIIVLAASLSLVSSGMQTVSREEATKIIAGRLSGLDACFVMLDLESGEYLRVNPERCAERLSPCSTFKIPNSLIALETGVLEDENSEIKWDGRKRARETWNQDQTLASAVKYSAVWYFQEVAGRIGAERMAEYLGKIGYGNGDISGGLKRFWLADSLKISADEQVEFLARMLKRELPFSERNVEIVVKILRQDDVAGKLYGKTGSGRLEGETRIGWFVGFVELEGNFKVFALDLKGGKGTNGFLAKDKVIVILRALGLLPGEEK